MKTQLKNLRKQSGYKTQRDMANALGVSWRRYSAWERGESDFSFAQAIEIADLLDCSLDELAGRECTKKSTPKEYADPRQQVIMDDFERLDDSARDAAVGAIRGMTYACAKPKSEIESKSYQASA